MGWPPVRTLASKLAPLHQNLGAADRLRSLHVFARFWQDIEDATLLKSLKESMHPDDFKMLFRNVGELL